MKYTALTRAYRRRAPGEPRAIGYLYILPALIVYAVFLLYPFGQSVWLSFVHWDGLTVATPAGFDNYRALFSDPSLRAPFLHALLLLVFYAALPVAIGLLLAAVMSRVRVRGMTFFRTVLFLPQVLALIVVGVAWRSILAPDGLLNDTLRAVGLGGLARPWLGDYTWALPAVGVIGTWVGTGLCMVLFLAGAQRIPRELYEAARMDGAGPLREFLTVTLPGLRPQIAVALTLTIVAGLRNFDLIYITTSGGPGNATSVPAYEVYHRAFETNQVGSAAAVGVGLTVLIFVLTVTVSRLVEGRRA
ncbi:sugar ABC transporter permease [Streptomyces samsunensis]|uniref:Sugar ABC transporter permease n=2 Tax=Streptomyces malaysiensis TaxID=92644 RepID=A0ABX6WF79_STRMQ|nr:MULTISPECIES: sugar ABC transporter permease [Streptomyces]MCC4314590.1 sugar ABC transporter permease [Streptomyces malaysiensis]MCM3806550.1 sugar ABC transporter permease [Streptomyces sp. DR7-3]MCQ6247660.1 sugar ABC transporter permease [Streptomyces malaysiensis]NIY70295.1 sugar ABC transporter permease [Streptomyces malaysiensis]NUH37221.1 sugar ABC transporter permease [Streptomyces samsunensis]